MSKAGPIVNAILEWSPSGVSVWTPEAPAVQEFDTIGEAVRSANLKSRTVGVAIARRHVFLKSLHLPQASKEEAAVILRLQADQLFPLPASELAIDFAFVGSPGPEGVPTLAAAMKADLLRTLLKGLKEHGIKPAWVAPAALAAQAVANEQTLSDALILTETADGLAIDVIQNGLLVATRVAGTRASTIDVTAESARTQAAYKLTNPQTVLSKGILGVAGSRTLTRSTLSHLADSGPAINLELPEVAIEKSARKVVQRRNLALLLGVAVLGYGLLIWDERDTHGAKIAKVDKDFTTKKKSVTDSKGRFSTRLAQLDTGAAVIQNAFEPAQTATDAITITTNLLPSKAWLTGVTFERGRKMQVRGTALNGDAVSAFVDSLAAQSRFRDVQLLFANNTKLEETPVVQFSVTLHVIGNLPLVDKSKGVKKK